MITFIAFLFTVAGSVNWLLIGLLQYDYIAGFFGFQAALMSRIFYVLFGIGAIYLVLRVIINKGSFKIWERKKKKEKDEEKALEKGQKAQALQSQPAYANIEASREQVPQSSAQSNDNMTQNFNRSQFVDFDRLRDFRADSENDSKDSFEENENVDSAQSSSAPENFFEPPEERQQSQTLFDEHMNMKK